MAIWQKQLVRHSIAVKSIVVTLLSLMLIFIAVIPLFSRLMELNKKIESRTKEAEDISNRVAILTGLDQGLLGQRVEVLDRALPNKKDVLLYLSTIDALSRELGLSFKGISLAPGNVSEASGSGQSARKAKTVPDEVPGVHSLETEVKIAGDKESIFAFLRAIERSLPLMLVKDVKVAITGEENLALSLRLGMLWATGDLSNVKGAITLFTDKEEEYFQQLAEYKVYASVPTETVLNSSLNRSSVFAPVTIDLVENSPIENASSSGQSSN